MRLQISMAAMRTVNQFELHYCQLLQRQPLRRAPCLTESRDRHAAYSIGLKGAHPAETIAAIVKMIIDGEEIEAIAHGVGGLRRSSWIAMCQVSAVSL